MGRRGLTTNGKHVRGIKMQQKDAIKLKDDRGDEPCSHPSLEKEYELGTATGDYVCTSCGESRAGSAWNKKHDEKQGGS